MTLPWPPPKGDPREYQVEPLVAAPSLEGIHPKEPKPALGVVLAVTAGIAAPIGLFLIWMLKAEPAMGAALIGGTVLVVGSVGWLQRRRARRRHAAFEAGVAAARTARGDRPDPRAGAL